GAAAVGRPGTRGRTGRREHRGAVRRHRATACCVEGRMSESPALWTDGLGKRYGAKWALRDCTREIPAGSVTALVGPNGAGKTTLLQLAVGLSKPSAGGVRVLGKVPREDARWLLPRVGFVAQEHPLHRGFTVGEALKLGRKLNPSWDEGIALERVEGLGLPLNQ